MPQTATLKAPLMANLRTADRTHVHRRSLSEVFLTDTHRADDLTYFSAAQLPRWHPYYGDHLARPPGYDPLLLLEACRQSAIAGSHLYFGVPFGHDFILTGESIRITHPGGLVIGPEPCDLLLRTVITGIRERDGVVTGLDFALNIIRDESEVGLAQLGIRYKRPESYRKLRLQGRAKAGLPGLPSSASLPASPQGSAVRPILVGRTREENVLLQDATVLGEEVHAHMRIPAGHPSMFDHPLDHIPGQVLVEAARQLAVYTARETRGMGTTRIDEITAVFTRFGELDRPVRLSTVTDAAMPFSRLPVTVTVSQKADVICRITCTLTGLKL
jgi:2-oxo-3-(phosphooxy)propyl 3-oxoalkanoate synthase